MQSRVFGLDFMRATAIMLVVFWHSYDVVTGLAPGFAVPFVVDGVDLFFVLSGYLVGGLLLRAANRAGLSWSRRAFGFWRRRLFRTLPNYYLFLLLNIGLLAAGLGKGLLNHNALAYFAFLQSVWISLGLFFWESWSVVVEVWFYMLYPALVFVCIGALRMPVLRAFVLVALVFIAIPTIVRLVMAEDIAAKLTGDLFVRDLVIQRIDTVLFGVLAALAAARFPNAWRSYRWVLFPVGLLGLLITASFYDKEHMHYSLTWYYTLNAISVALLLPLLSTWLRTPRGGGVFTWVSQVSYALFLVHLPLRAVLEPYYTPTSPFMGWVQLILYWSLCFFLAWLVYRFYERPMTDLRER